MNLSRRLKRIETLHGELFPCPTCAENGGIRVAMLEGDEPFDEASMVCSLCGTPPRRIVVRLMDGPVPQAGIESVV